MYVYEELANRSFLKSWTNPTEKFINEFILDKFKLKRHLPDTTQFCTFHSNQLKES